MLDVRRETELPSVLDTDPDVVQQLSARVLQVVGCEIPGLGIRHEGGGGHVDVHHMHRDLVACALKGLKQEIRSDWPFGGVGGLDADSATPIHVDYFGFSEAEKVSAQSDLHGLFMTLRLHTAARRNGAHVIMANAGPGTGNYDMCYMGDRELYNPRTGTPTTATAERGYTARSRLKRGDFFSEIEYGGYDPAIFQGHVYLFEQRPLHSVFFRSISLIGPASVHGFRSMNEDMHRTALTSDLQIESQSLSKGMSENE